jgi:hypothetical protein
MPFIQDIKKEPLSKGFSRIIYKWFRRAMLALAKSDKKRARYLTSSSTR